MTEDKRVVKLGYAYGVRYEAVDSFEKSIFSEEYSNASFAIREIVERNHQLNEDYQKSGTEYRNRQQICNVLAFVGRRGSGKTSAMLSYLEYLKDYYKLISRVEIEEYRVTGKNDEKVMFTGLEYIDAALLEQDEDLMELVLVKMLKKFMELDQEAALERRNDYDYKRRELYRCFNNVYAGLKNLNNKSDIFRQDGSISLEPLKKLSFSQNIKEAFQKLVGQYLAIMQYSEIMDQTYPQNRYLVITIDDMDMNASKGFDMLEKIQRYFMIPNVIVLLAIDYEQMERICQKHFVNEYSMKCPGEHAEELYQRSMRLGKEYLEKIIPLGKKVFMPGIKNRTGIIYDNIKYAYSEDEQGEGFTGKDLILRNMYKKLALCVDPISEEIHYLEASSLRMINAITKDLHDLPDISEFDGVDLDDNKKQELRGNYTWFWNEILNKYLERPLNREERHLIEMIGEVSFKDKNQYIIDFCSAKLPNETKSVKRYGDFGYMIYMLHLYEKQGRENKIFTNWIKMYYSMLLSRLFVLRKYEADKSQRWNNYIDYILCGEMLGSWEYKIFPNLIDDRHSIPLNIGRFELKCEGRYIYSGDYLISKYKNDKDLRDFRDIQMLIFMFCNTDEDKGKYINIQLPNKNVPAASASSTAIKKKGNISQSIKIQLFNCDKLFSLSSFFFNCVKYEKIFDKIDEELKKKGYLQYSVRKEFDDWKNKYNTTMAFPFNNIELLMNMAQDLEIKIGPSFIGDIGNIRRQIKSYLEVIENKLQKVDEYYKYNLKVERKYGYAEIFRNCPVVVWLQDILENRFTNKHKSSVLRFIYKVASSQNNAGQVDTSF